MSDGNTNKIPEHLYMKNVKKDTKELIKGFVEKFYPHCGNERLYQRLDKAIERGEITEEEARQIYKEESE